MSVCFFFFVFARVCGLVVCVCGWGVCVFWSWQRVVPDLFSNFKWARSSGYSRWTSCASDTSTWAIHGKQKIGRWRMNLTMSQDVQKSLVFLYDNADVLSSETVFLRIGPLFHRIEPRVSQDRTFFEHQSSYSKETPCVTNSEKVKMNAKRFSQGHWTFPRSWRRKEVVCKLWKMELHRLTNVTQFSQEH